MPSLIDCLGQLRDRFDAGTVKAVLPKAMERAIKKEHRTQLRALEESGGHSSKAQKAFEHGILDKHRGLVQGRLKEISVAREKAVEAAREAAKPVPPTPPPEPKTTGVAQRVHDARFKAGQTGEVFPGEGTGPEDLIRQGREALAAGADPEAILATGKPVSGVEMAVLRARHEQLSKATDAADKAGDKPAYEAAFKAETDFAQRIKPAATEASEVFRALQGETNIDTGTFTGLRRAYLDQTGKDVAPEHVPTLERASARVRKAATAERAAVEKLGSAIKNIKTKLPASPEMLRSHFAERMKALLPCK